MYRIQLPYGEVIDKNWEIVKLDLPKNYCMSEYFKFLLCLHDVEKPNFQTSISNVINNRHDLRNYLLATGDISKSIQENLKSVAIEGKLNDAIICHALDTKNKHILADPNSLQVTFKDIKKFDVQNPNTGKVLTEIETSKLSDKKNQRTISSTKR